MQHVTTGSCCVPPSLQDHYSPTAYPHSPAAGSGPALTPTKKGSPVRAARRAAGGEPVHCANCGCDSTCLWRRDKEDPSRTLCNACGIYKTNNGIDRPTNGLFPFWKNGKERVVRRSVSGAPARLQHEPVMCLCTQNESDSKYAAPVASLHGCGFANCGACGEKQRRKRVVLVTHSARLHLAVITRLRHSHSSTKLLGQKSGQTPCTHVLPPAPAASLAATAAAQQTARPVVKPYKHQVLSAAEYKAQRQQDLLKATAPAASSSSAGSAAGDSSQAGQQQAALGLGLDLQAGGYVHPGALGMPAAPGLSLPLPLPLEAATDPAAAFQQYLPPADVLHIADTAAAAAAAVAPQELLLPALRVGSTVAHSLTAASSSMEALLAALAAAQARGSISDQLNMADDAPEQHTAALAAPAPAVAAPGSSGSGQPELVGWVGELSRESVLGGALRLALAHAVRMQEPVMLPSGHKVFPDGRVVLCVVNDELGLAAPRGSSGDAEVAAAQVAAAILSAGIAGSSSAAAAAGDWGAADARVMVSSRADAEYAGSIKDGSEPAAAAVLAAASAEPALSAAVVAGPGAEQLVMEDIVEQQ